MSSSYIVLYLYVAATLFISNVNDEIAVVTRNE